MTAAPRPRPLVLCILDGFGERAERDANAIRLAKTPHLDALAAYPHTLIGTSGPDVGLPKGQMGNSEVGHLNFGAGRIAMMDITRIDVAVAEGTLPQEPDHRQHHPARQAPPREPPRTCSAWSRTAACTPRSAPLRPHRRGAREGVPVVVHAFLDGRDTPPRSAGGYLDQLERALDGGKKGVIGTVSGRYWAMDRDKRWDRVHKAFKAIVRGEAPVAESAHDALARATTRASTTSSSSPSRIGDYTGVKGGFMADFAAASPAWEWRGEEAGFSFNFRPDRMRELSAMLTRKNLPPEVGRAPRPSGGRAIHAFDEGSYATMTEYDADPRAPRRLSQGTWSPTRSASSLARAGLRQLRCAETEKYAHVTYFFSGGREPPFDGEDRKLVPSPRDVATYDLKPEMSAAGVAHEVVAAIDERQVRLHPRQLRQPRHGRPHRQARPRHPRGGGGRRRRRRHHERGPRGRRRAPRHRRPRQLRADEGRERPAPHRPHH